MPSGGALAPFWRLFVVKTIQFFGAVAKNAKKFATFCFVAILEMANVFIFLTLEDFYNEND